MEFWPNGTALTLVVTPMSAVLGFTDTAPSDQFDAPLNVSEIGTAGAPVRLLPLEVTSGGSAPPDARFHCDTCGPGMATVWFPPMASVSRIIPFTTLGTSSCEDPPAAPSAETNVPRGTV